MAVYWSMLGYVLIVGFGGKAFAEKYNIRDKYKSGTTLFFAMLTLALPLFFISFRTFVADTPAYIGKFNESTMILGDIPGLFGAVKGPLFDAYIIFFKRFISVNPTVYLASIAIITAAGILRLYYKYSTNYPYSILLFFLSCNFTWLMNGMRQFLALGIIALFCDYIFEKKTLKFMLVILACYFIHSTSILWVPIYFIVQSKPWSKKILLVLSTAVLIVIFVDQFTDLLTLALEETEYATATQQFAEDDGSNFLSTLIFAVPSAISLWKRKRIEEVAPRHINIMINISVIGVALSLVANFTSGILMGRLPIYCIVFNYALLPWLFENCFDHKDRFVIKFLCIVGYFAYFCFYMLIVAGGMPYVSTGLGISC